MKLFGRWKKRSGGSGTGSISDNTNLPERSGKKIFRIAGYVDKPFMLLVIVLLCIGTIFVLSASYVYAESKFGDSYYFARRQIFFAFLSFVVMCVTSQISFEFLRKYAWWIFGGSYLLLWAVFFYGADANGARRWIYLGPVSVQPSEIVKFAVVLLCARYITDQTNIDPDRLRSFKNGVLPFGILVVLLAAPLYLQPHISAMVIIFSLIFIMMYLGGVRTGVLASLLGIGGAGLAGLMRFTDHARNRIVNWLHPELDPLGGSWQPLQSLYAIGSGGLWGVGLGQSKQKHLYLPEPQNDYIFAILCEEMGWIFAIAVIVLFVLLIWRGLYIAKKAPDKFSSLLAMGIVIQIGLQVFLNIAIVTNSLPSTGVSLPLFSYGGSSLILFMAEMGVVLNISKISYKEQS